MLLEARLKKIEDKVKELGNKYTYTDHPHVAETRQIKGDLYNDDGTEFISNHPKDCPIPFIIIITRGEEYYEVSA